MMASELVRLTPNKGQPRRLATRGLREVCLQHLAGRESPRQLEGCTADPQRHPRQRAETAVNDVPAGIGRAPGPGQKREQRVVKHRAGRSSGKKAEAGEQIPKAFAYPPHDDSPGDRRRDGRPFKTPYQQADTDCALHHCSRGVPYSGVMGGDQTHSPKDGVVDCRRLAHGGLRQVASPPVCAEEVRLKLKACVEQPQHPDDSAQLAASERQEAREARESPPTFRSGSTAVQPQSPYELERATGGAVGATTPPAGSTVTR
jgi:hypothetical protein